LREDDDLAIVSELLAYADVESRQRLPALAAIDRDHANFPGVPAKKRDPQQLALKNEGWVREQRKQREGFPSGLVLRGNQQRTRWNFCGSADLEPDAASDPQQPQIDARPEANDREERAARHQQRRESHDRVDQQVQIEQRVEDN